MQALRARARLHEEIPDVPHLFQGIGLLGDDTGRDEGELVTGSRYEFVRSDR
jgi:hypothetical protein